MSGTSLSLALESEAKHRDAQARALTAEAVELRKASAALEHKLQSEPEIVLPDGTRREQLGVIITRLNGTATRRQINDMATRAGIPLGTVASLLGAKRHFHEQGGHWKLAPSVARVAEPVMA